MARSRSYYDDNIAHRLNDIDTADYRQCITMRDTLKHIHANRQAQLEYCISQLKKDNDAKGDASMLHSKEV